MSNSLAFKGIDCIIELSNEKSRSAPTFILPDLSAYIVLHQLDDGRTKARFIGPRTTGFLMNRRNRRKSLICKIRPEMLPLITERHCPELTDRSFPLASILGERAAAILQTGLSAPNNPEVHTVLEKALPLISPTSAPERLTIAFLQTIGNWEENHTVAGCAQHLGVSQRYLHRIITRTLGMNPKTALKIKRFGHCLHSQQRYPDHPWAQVAHHAGYFDQSHMIDEFQQFIGRSPGEVI